MNRRHVIKSSAAAVTAVGIVACKPKSTAEQASVQSQKFEWKMVTAWPKNFPGLGTGSQFFADAITQMSGGRLTIKVFGSGELVPAFEVFDAVSAGTAQMGHAAAYYWKGKVPEAQFFGAVPFGMNANEINSKEDIKGLVLRIPGLGGEVLSRTGETPQAQPGAELFTALQTGTIDAMEWVGPYNDLAFGLYQAASFYYCPGWHEPTACLEGIVNQAAYDALPEDLKKIIDLAAVATNQYMLAEFTANNQRALETLQKEHHVQLREFPADVLAEFKMHAATVLAELGQQSEIVNKIYQSYTKFAQQVQQWFNVSELAYLKAR